MATLRTNITNIASATNYISNLKIRKITDKVETQVSGLPENPRITFINWSQNENGGNWRMARDSG